MMIYRCTLFAHAYSFTHELTKCSPGGDGNCSPAAASSQASDEVATVSLLASVCSREIPHWHCRKHEGTSSGGRFSVILSNLLGGYSVCHTPAKRGIHGNSYGKNVIHMESSHSEQAIDKVF